MRPVRTGSTCKHTPMTYGTVHRRTAERHTEKTAICIAEGGAQDIGNWSKLFDGRRVFADYFRCDMKTYGQVDMKKMQLVIQLNNDLNLYKEKKRRLRGLVWIDGCVIAPAHT